MVEVERDNTRGIAGAGLGLGIAGTALGLLQNGNLGNILGGCGGCGNDAHVTRYEASQAAKIAELESELKLRDSSVYTLGEVNKLRDYMEHKFDCVNAQLNAQAVYNATNTANLGCIQGQVAELMALTKRVVPNASICPGWGEATVSVSTTTT